MGAADLLSPEDLENFRWAGFIVPRFRLSPKESARLRAMITQLMEDNETLEDAVVNTPHVPGAGGVKSGLGWMDFAAHPAIVDMVEQIMGPDIILRGSLAFHKRPGTGPATPWHRDAATVPIDPIASTQVWIAASDSFIDNACLRVIPGSHKNRDRGRHSLVNSRVTLDPSEYDEATAVDVELEAGQLVIFDIFTIHGSRPNTGTRERTAFSPRFMPATSKFHHYAKRPDGMRPTGAIDPGDRPLILVRGVDRAGNDFRRGHPA